MIEPERDAPDLEDLAAYLDGRLSGALKARVEERLARDEDYYEVFLENVRYQQEMEEIRQREEGGGTVVAPAVWWRSRRAVAVAAPLAAAATLVAVIGLSKLMGDPSTGEWVAGLNAPTIVGLDNWSDPGWHKMRGVGHPEPLDPDQQRRQEVAFRIGTHAVDLRVTLTAGDRGAASGQAAQLYRWIGANDLLLPLTEVCANLQQAIETENLDALRTQTDTLEDLLAENLEDTPEAGRYAVGKWNEAGRLAALTGNEDVLARIFRRRGVAQGIEEIERHLGDLEAAALAQPSPDFEAAGTAFREIARKLAGRG